MEKNKAAAVRLQGFKGREAKLRETIFNILAIKGPMTVYALLHEIREKEALQGLDMVL